MTNSIEKFLKFLPLATLVLIIASSTKLAAYYNAFNINIVEYLSVSEYIPLFIDDLHTLVYVIVIMLFGFTVGESMDKKERIKNQKKSGTEEDIKKAVYRKRYAFLICIGVFLIVLPFVLFYKYDSISEKLEFLVGFLIVLMFLILVLMTTFKKVNKMLLSLWLIIFVFAPLIILGYKEAYVILDNRQKEVYTIKFKGKSTATPIDLKFLGSSEKYIFLYDSSKLESVIRPISNVEEIRVKRK